MFWKFLKIETIMFKTIQVIQKNTHMIYITHVLKFIFWNS